MERTPAVELPGPRLLLRPGTAADAAALHRIRGEASVAAWWGTVEPEDEIAEDLLCDSDEVMFVIEVGGEVAGAIQYSEENEPDYRHAGIDLYLADAFQGRGYGSEAVAVLAAYLVDVRGHHRLTIDPSAGNERAIRAYARIGFRTVGLMREYERGPDGVWRDGLLMDLLAGELVRVS